MSSCASQEAPFVLVTVVGTSYMPEEVKGIEIIITIKDQSKCNPK